MTTNWGTKNATQNNVRASEKCYFVVQIIAPSDHLLTPMINEQRDEAVYPETPIQFHPFIGVCQLASQQRYCFVTH
jgi:hypothetical protein